MRERGGEIRCKIGEYAWVGKTKRQTIKNRGEGVEFLVKQYLCDIIKAIEDTKIDESMWKKIPGERRTKYVL